MRSDWLQVAAMLPMFPGMKHFVWVVILQLAASGADAYYTNRNLHRHLHEAGFQEQDPLARPFVHNTTDLSLSCAASSGAFAFAEYRLLKRHNKLSKTAAAIYFAGHVFGAATSAEREGVILSAPAPARRGGPGLPGPTLPKPVD
jgi:hypothetical protein